MFRKILVGMLVVGLVAVPLSAQEGASLTVRVVDPGGDPVPGARVRIDAQETDNAAQRTQTNRSGEAEIPGLRTGRHELTVTLEGFETHRETVEMTAGGARIDVTLELAQVTQEIVVTGHLPELGSEVTLTGRELDRRAAHDLARSLRDEESLSAFRRGGVNLEPTVRGLQETQVAMFVDGTRTFAAGPARMDSDLSHVSPHAVETVRVVKGPYALSWGAGALSALQVETFRPGYGTQDFELGGEITGSYGDNLGAVDGYGGLWGSNDRWSFSALHNRRQGDDYEDGAGRDVPADYASDDSRWSLGVKLSDSTELQYAGGYQGQDDLDYPGRILDATFFKTRSHDLKLQRAGDGSVTEVFLQAYANRKDHAMNNDEKPTAQPAPGRIPPFALDVVVTTESNTAGGRGYVGFLSGDWRFKVGADVYSVEQTADRTVARRSDGRALFDDVVWPDVDRDNLGAYGQAIYQGDGLEVGGTLRVDRMESTAGRASDFFLANTMGDLDQEDTEISAAVSGRFRLTDDWLVSAGLGRVVRAPDTLERYSDRFPATKFQLPAELLGNPGLEPETSLELNVGTEARWGDVLLNVSLFHREIDDYVTIQPDPSVPKRLPLSPPVVFRYVNGDSATFRGGELELSQRISGLLSWWGSVSYTWAEDDTFDEPVLGIAPLTARLGLRVEPAGGPWWGAVTATVAEEQDRVAAVRFETPTPGYTTVDLRGGVRLSGGFELLAGVENVTDKDYVHHLNSKNPFTGERIGEPGRNAYVGLGWRF